MTREEAIKSLRSDNEILKMLSAYPVLSKLIDKVLESPWRSVKEELPKDYKKLNLVLLRDKWGQYHRDICFYSDHWFGGYIDNDDRRYRVTHWMPIPELPEEKEEQK